MKTEYKINRADVHIPDEWEFSYKNGICKYTEIFYDGDEVVENTKKIVNEMICTQKTIFGSIKVSKYRNRLTIKGKLEPINAIGMLLAEMIAQYAIRGGDLNRFMESFLEVFEYFKKDETGK